MIAGAVLSLPSGARLAVATALMPLICAPEPLGAQAGDIAFGEYLAGDCTSCHSPDGALGIPPITGWQPEDFVQTMQDFRDGTRQNEVMEMMAGRLSDDEIAALAAYFAMAAP